MLLAASWPMRAGERGPIVDLDAQELSPGVLSAWKNTGSAGGEFAAMESMKPTVVEAAGRRAVTFGDGRYLTSSFPTPVELTTGNPFTLAAWALVPAASKRDVIVSWASRPRDTAEFSYGAGPDGAFFGWDKSARFNHLPKPGEWHHLAYVYAANQLTIYTDGVLDSRREMKIAAKPGGHVIVGAGWNSVDGKGVFPLHGSLSRVQIFDRALGQREVRNAAGWTAPFNASPADGATISAEDAGLKWEPGDERAVIFRLRVADDPHAIETPGAPPTDVRPARSGERPAGLVPGRTIYWRIEQFDEKNQLLATGPVWKFTIDNGPAGGPLPRDRVAGVPMTTRSLAWTPGRYAKGQVVYFGKDQSAVAAGMAKLATGLPATANSCPLAEGALEYGTTYYWRVAEDNGDIPAAPGAVWAFRTADEPREKDVTFFVSSDCHYGLGNNAELNRAAIDRMNWLPGTMLPKPIGGGIVRTPRGVVLDGDLLDKGFEAKTAVPAWAEFTRDYGLNGGDGRLAYPVFEGFGNHDGMTGKSISREGIRQRNKTRNGLRAVSANGFHYSWDWDHVHGVQLNLFPGKDSADCIVGPPNHHPEDALGFLIDDLAKNVGTSDRIVIVFCHYCYSGGMADWWTDAAKDRFYQAVKAYRIVLIHGHSHGAYFYSWKGIPVISDGAMARPDGQTGDFFMVRLTKDELIAAHRKAEEWGITEKLPLPRSGISGK